MGLLLGAQIGQLSLDAGKTLDRVYVLHANQMAMQQHQMGLLRKQQQEAAEDKVVFSANFSTVFQSREFRLSLALSNTLHILGL